MTNPFCPGRILGSGQLPGCRVKNGTGAGRIRMELQATVPHTKPVIAIYKCPVCRVLQSYPIDIKQVDIQPD